MDRNGFGIPKALGGGFAITYRFSGGNKSYAVRCFHKEVRNLQERYAQIHSCLKTAQSPLFVRFEYQHAGIKVKGVDHPIVKMEWATGMTLGEYVERNYNNRSAIEKLRRSFAEMETELAQRGVGHGDLQNGNVLVSPQGQLRLVDYDGMFVPGMNAGGGSELGHKHFQHPARSAGDFTPTIDRFSFLVIDLSLWAITFQPDLFRRFSTGENILFSANDFADPSTSQIFQALMALKDQAIQKAVASFATVCKSPISSIPRLGNFLAGSNIPPASAPSACPTSQKYIGAFPVIDASSFIEVCRYIGDKVELVGKIVSCRENFVVKDKPYVFINFGDWRGSCARITIWSEGLKTLADKPNAAWREKWIVVYGMIDPVYNSVWGYKSVGITLSYRSQLHEITEEEALWRLGRGARPGSPQAPASPAPSTAKNADIFQTIQGNQSKPASGSPILPLPSQPQTPVLTSTKAQNEAILKLLIPPGSGGVGGCGPTSGQRSSGQPTSGQPSGAPSKGPSGCLVVLAVAIMSFVAIRFIGRDGAISRPAKELTNVGVADSHESPSDRVEWKVVAIKDGDTITVLRDKTHVTLRLEGIDCPESGQAFGKEAKAIAHELAFGKSVTLRTTGTDRYGRTLAHVFLPDGKELNRELIHHGYAWWFRKYSVDKSLGKLEGEAQANKRGLWADAKPVAPWDWRARN